MCQVPGCGKPAAGYSTLCATHGKTKARHGHPLQTGVTREELKPYEKAIQTWLDTRAAPMAWAILEEQWASLAAASSGYIELAGAGYPHHRHTLEASEMLLRAANNEPPRDAITRLLAMGYMRHALPSRFLSEEAFGFQVARQVRSMAGNGASPEWEAQIGSARRKPYRDAPARTMKALWHRLAGSGFTSYGEEIAKATELAQKVNA